MIETEYGSILTVLEALDIDDLTEVWEVLDEQGNGVNPWATQP